MSYKGVYTAMITPMLENQNQDVDFAGLQTNVQRQLEAGVDGIVLLGTTAETPTLSSDEQYRVVDQTRDQVEGRIPIIVGTGTYSTRNTIEQTLKAQEWGADAALIVTPCYNKPEQEGIYRHFEAVHNATNIPIIVYNIQGRTGRNIETDTLERITELPRVVGVKEASGNIAQMDEVIQRLGSENFSVLSGDDALTYSLMNLGGDGVISVLSNVIPEEIVALVRDLRSSNYEDHCVALERHRSLSDLTKAAFCETNPQPIKYMMEIAGYSAGPCRLPLTRVNPNSQARINKVFDSWLHHV